MKLNSLYKNSFWTGYAVFGKMLLLSASFHQRWTLRMKSKKETFASLPRSWGYMIIQMLIKVTTTRGGVGLYKSSLFLCWVNVGFVEIIDFTPLFITMIHPVWYPIIDYFQTPLTAQQYWLSVRSVLTSIFKTTSYVKYILIGVTSNQMQDEGNSRI